MTDILTPEKRSKNMAAIKCKDTKPEIYIRSNLFALGYRYRKNDSRVLGHPDIYLPRYKTAIFVHGCFWHRHSGCKYAYTPKSHVEFWTQKFQSNIQRGQVIKEGLAKEGIKCLIIWECTIKQMRKSSDKESEIIQDICDFLISTQEYMEL